MTTPKKAETHERIVASAARAIREHGYDGVSVAEIMKEAGLTHGGFYAHFASRDALVLEALEHGGAEALARLSQAIDSGDEGLAALADAYLSDSHAKAPEHGCVLAALGSETRRQPEAIRMLTSRQVRAFTALAERLVAGHAGDETERRDEAMLIVSALVGAMVISRAVDSAALAKQFRNAAKRFVSQRAR